MKKVALSLLVIAASGAYVWSQSGELAADDLLGGLPSNGGVEAGNIPRALSTPGDSPPDAVPPPVPFVLRGRSAAPDPVPEGERARKPSEKPPQLPPAAAESGPALSRSPRILHEGAGTSLPRQRPVYRELTASRLITRAAMTVTSNARYVDGLYTGPVVDAYYGPVQIQAIVRDGRLAGVKVLQYPSDRRTSVAINRQALPMLRDEVVSAQSASVNIVSGATLTSEAFIRSLDGALRQAGP